ncbi:MAG: hypothetical protein ACT4OT_10295 [Acidobacteriota bacterium]
MKRVLIVVVLVVAAAILGLWRTSGGVRQSLNRVVGASGEQSQGDVREEIRKSFELQPGARIDVIGINGKVTIETFGSATDGTEGAQDARAPRTKTAEVYVLRTAGGSEGLSRRQVTIEQTSAGLVIKGRQVGHGFWEHLFGTKANEDVTIKAPRQIALGLKGINGRVTGGDIDGALEVKGINGGVDLGQAKDTATISGVNGNISVGLNSLTDTGARVSGVNGNIELKLASALNAQLTAKGMNGNVRSEIPGVTIEKDDYGSRYSARIGNGGPPINFSGVNGNVRLTRANLVATDNGKKIETKPTKTSSEK